MNLIQATGLSCRLAGTPLFVDLNFTLGAGEVVLLRGRNGSGKSTFLKALTGRQPFDQGQVLLGGRDLHVLSEAEREVIAPVVDQQPVLDWDVPAIENLVDRLTMGPGLWRWFCGSRRAARRRAWMESQSTLDRFGLSSVMHRPTRELSLGRRRLLMLARALRRRPDGLPRALLLDEPLAGLQQERIGVVLDALRERLSEGWGVVIAEHVLEVESLRPRYLDFPYRPDSSRPRDVAEVATEIPIADRVSSPETRDERALRRHGHVAGPTDTTPAQELLRLTDVSVGYYDWEVVPRVSLRVNQGEITALVGPNAAGKSTLLRGLFRDADTQAWLRGAVAWRGQAVAHLRESSAAPSRAVAWVPQDRFDFPGLTVDETLRGGLVSAEVRGWQAPFRDLLGKLRPSEKLAREFVVELIGRLTRARPDGRTILESRWETLSGGERAIAALALGLVNRPALVVLDEPAANLDSEALQELKTALRRYVTSESAGCLVVEHRDTFLNHFVDRTVRLADGGSASEPVDEPTGGRPR